MTVNNNNNFSVPKTILEHKQQLAGWRDDLNALESAINSASINQEQSLQKNPTLENISQGLKLSSDDIAARLNLADPNKESVLIKDLMEMQDTISKVSTVFSGVSRHCATAEVNTLQEQLNEFLFVGTNQKEENLSKLQRSFGVLALNPLYAHEKDRIQSCMQTIAQELNILNEQRKEKARLFEQIASVQELLKKANDVSYLNETIPKNIQLEIRPILFKVFDPKIQSFDHLNIFDGRFSLEQIKQAVEMLTKGIGVEDIKQTKELTTASNAKICTIDPNSLLILPDELLLKLFQYMDKPKDFITLSLLCKRFYGVSQEESAFQCNLNMTLPPYLANSQDPSIQSMLLKNKIKLAIQNEAKFHSQELLKSNLKKVLPRELSISEIVLPKTIFGNILVHANHSFDDDMPTGTLLVYDLETGSEFSIKAHDSNVTSCQFVHAPKPYLVTTASDGVKIWDFKEVQEQKKTTTESLKLHHSSQTLALSNSREPTSSEKSPVITVHKSMLAVGDQNCVLVFDCAQGFASNKPLKINLTHAPKQILITDEHFIVVGDMNYNVWKMSIIKDSFKQNSELECSSSTSHNVGHSIRFAKINKDKIFVAHNEPFFRISRFICGEIIDVNTNETLREFSFSQGMRGIGRVYSVDFADQYALTGGEFITLWDLNEKGESHKDMAKYFWGSSVHKVFTLGEKALFAFNNGMSIFDFKTGKLKQVQYKNEDMEFKKCYDPLAYKTALLSFELFGKYLVTENQDSKKRIITVFDLSK